jgi:hypothetical protein
MPNFGSFTRGTFIFTRRSKYKVNQVYGELSFNAISASTIILYSILLPVFSFAIFDSGASVFTMSQQYLPADVNAHNTADSLWVIIDDDVYDLTQFQNEHPGMCCYSPTIESQGRLGTELLELFWLTSITT